MNIVYQYLLLLVSKLVANYVSFLLTNTFLNVTQIVKIVYYLNMLPIILRPCIKYINYFRKNKNKKKKGAPQLVTKHLLYKLSCSKRYWIDPVILQNWIQCNFYSRLFISPFKRKNSNRRLL